METCVTLGMLKEGQAEKLKAAGLDYYNHNLDTAPEFYGQVISTHSQQRSLRHPRSGARGRHQCCAAAASSAWARRAASAPRCWSELANLSAAARVGADQPTGADARHAAGKRAAAGSLRVRAHHRRGAHHHARLRWCGCRQAARR
jgi:hypothetical protein